MSYPKTIAIDGPAGSGKSTLGKRLADALGYLFFDTGVMYRAVTLLALEQGLAMENEPAITLLAQETEIDIRQSSKTDGRNCDVLANGQDITWAIRQPQVDANVSVVSAYPGVRQALTRQQQRIGMRGNVIMVGRDIGTVVLPQADLKIYLDASAKERARRRFLELHQRGEKTEIETILNGLRRRDEIDSSREIAPLRPAEDAIILESDSLDADQVFARALKIIQQQEHPADDTL